ncbi:hypothetical protein CLIB1423_27S00694 [[Candida] railenensis]|uniref:Uncharacterized protein n=1 Tax=[Candida] railenensis TaxID=45579 RepID=A0A9P0W1A7_9ASCO|nr:hypothetical protein CLIB1423_27S00694 [[Candida] railenensis]
MNSSNRGERVITSIRAELKSRKIKKFALGLFTKVLSLDYEDVQICSQSNTLITEIVTPNHRFVLRPNMNYERNKQSSANLLTSVPEYPTGSSETIMTSGASLGGSASVTVGATGATIPCATITYQSKGLPQRSTIQDMFPPSTSSDLEGSQSNESASALNADISSVGIFPVSSQDVNLGLNTEEPTN